MTEPTASSAPETEMTASVARRVAARIALTGGVAILVVGVVIAAAADSIPLWAQLLPFAASVLVLGFPHGAVDHLVLPRARSRPITPRDLAFVGSLYLVVGGLYAIVWWRAPAAAFAAFIALTLVHWGQGDVYALVALAGADHLRTRAVRALTAFVRGGIPMLVPLIAFPAEYAFVAQALVGLFDPAAATALEPAFTLEARFAVGAFLATAILGSLAFGLHRADDRGPWLLDAGETLGLVAYFAVVPPILAIGLYFPFWHSLRHILRAMLLDGQTSGRLARRCFAGAFSRFARDAAPLTAGALVLFAVLALAIPTTPATPADLLGLYLVGIAVLTLPHVVVVTLLDRRIGLWTPRSRS
ncbi:beta-carotene 15,15'-dioxygenase, Brp/Blh family [Natronorubrum sp. JWXQ-INN-674]|uniref:Probable beta-carotene 15,15'-dioxygenase n=1 Tax=Natronorubrum halalkaliphilum TaxID=2691917 RepID=A0A6B0VJU0_9EURY|nr:Brp/Blh family beta-carotene 15,15'-dioxygenase [Natronorubrum halalkaliphilum]MXV61082.1 beta-carotene 15,15'-dioxygenase, Brp/Blh family [Natronorubrum halalkaliphilum]